MGLGVGEGPAVGDGPVVGEGPVVGVVDGPGVMVGVPGPGVGVGVVTREMIFDLALSVNAPQLLEKSKPIILSEALGSMSEGIVQ